jgi:ferrous iron transport protein A
MLLDELPLRQSARITDIDWSVLADEEALRLVALGFEPGAELRIAHRGVLFGRDPLAIRLGRMTIGIRRAHARAIAVEVLPETATSSPGLAATLPKTKTTALSA